MDLPCSLPTLASAILLGASAIPASAQTYRPDADGYPCARNASLTVVQSDIGFSIREKQDRPAVPATPVAVRLGSSLTLDSQLFARTSLVGSEANHVPQR
jgi:hypothetical protein